MDPEEYHDRYRRYFDAVTDALNINEDIKILDIGIKPYVFTEQLLKTHDRIEVYGVNYSEDDDVTIAGHDVQLRACNVDKEPIPFADNQFDRILMSAIIEHLFHPYFALREARRVLKPDGILVVGTPNAVNLRQRFKMVRGINIYNGYGLENKYNRHNREYTADELCDLLEVTGFDIKRCELVNERRTGILPRLLGLASSLWPPLRDTIIVQAKKADPADRRPIVYRQGLHERSDWSEYQERMERRRGGRVTSSDT